MSGIMSPPVADEPAPKRLWVAVLVGCLLVAVIAGLTALRYPEKIPESLLNSTDTPPEMSASTIVFELPRQGKHIDAFRYAIPLARGGDAQAQRLIGTYMATGIDGAYQRDFCAAAEWFNKAAKSGEPFSQLMLAALYISGEGVQRNGENARYWFHAGVYNAKASGNDLTDYIDAVRYIEPYDEDFIRSDTTPPQPQGPRSYDDAPPLITETSVPRIPIIGALYGAYAAKSVGCYGKATEGFYQVFYEFRRKRYEQQRR